MLRGIADLLSRSILNKTIQLASILILIFTLASGCTSLRYIPSDPIYAKDKLKTGDWVQVTTRDGRMIDFEVREVTEDKIVGVKMAAVDFSSEVAVSSIEVAFPNIDNIGRREYDGKKTFEFFEVVSNLPKIILLLAVLVIH